MGEFAGDDGTVDPGVWSALAALSDGNGDDVAVVAALAMSRVLVPVVAVPRSGDKTANGLADKTANGLADKEADMALMTLTAPDGRRALPVFGSLESLRQWDSAARPVPVECRRAAISAVAEGCDVMVLDPAGPMTFVVSRPALWALGQGRQWLPAYDDPEVGAVLAEVVSGEPDVVAVAAERGSQAELRVVLVVHAGLGEHAVRALAERIGAMLQATDVVRERVDGIELAVTTG